MRISFRALALLMLALCAFWLVGCGSKSADPKSGDDMNSALSAQQKANLAQHKKQADQ